MPQPKRYPSNAARQTAYRVRMAQSKREQAGVPPAPGPPAIATIPGVRRWRVLHRRLHTAAEQLADELQAYYDDRSVQWQESERAELYLELAAAYRELAERLDELPEL